MEMVSEIVHNVKISNHSTSDEHFEEDFEGTFFPFFQSLNMVLVAIQGWVG